MTGLAWVAVGAVAATGFCVWMARRDRRAVERAVVDDLIATAEELCRAAAGDGEGPW